MTELSGANLEPIFVSVKEAARVLGLSPWVTYKLLDEGKLEGRYHGRRRLVLYASIKAYAGSLSHLPEKTA